MTLPSRRKRTRSGIERVPERRYPKHLKWVRGFECSVSAGNRWHLGVGPVVAAHVRKNTDGGKSIKPSDWWVISLCTNCHDRQHAMGEEPFEKECGIDMWELAKEFAAKSPVAEVRAMAGVRL